MSNPAPPLARRIAGRTTDLIVVGILAAAALASGRQIVDWWREGPALPVPVAPAGFDPARLGAGGEPLLVEFGDLPVRMTQEVIETDPESAWGHLHRRMRDLLRAAPPSDSLPQSSPHELRILELAAAEEAEEELQGVGEVHRFADLLVGAFACRPGPGDTRETRLKSGRVVAWGLLVPAGTRSWRLYEFERLPVVSRADDEGLPAPPGGIRLLAIGGKQAGRLIAFRGEGSPDHWQRHFENWFAAGGWTRLGDWEGHTDSSGNQFRRSLSGGLELADVRLVRDNRGALDAVVQIHSIRKE